MAGAELPRRHLLPRLTLGLAIALAACTAPTAKDSASTIPPSTTSGEVSGEHALREYFEAKTPDAKKRALATLETFRVPSDPLARARLLRRALVKPTYPGSTRVTEQWGEPPLEGFVATPINYDPNATYPTLLGTTGYCSSPHASLQPFALPREEWAEISAAMKPNPGETPTRPALKIPFEDGIVLAPNLGQIDELDPKTFEAFRTRIMGILARANREFAIDPDRTVVSGLSLGSAVAYDVCSRHPDRFAGMADVSGGCPLHPTPIENLRPMEVYIMHGDADPIVTVTFAYQNSEYLKKLGVGNKLEIVPGGGHTFPEGERGERLAEWLKHRKRDPWPSNLELIFAASTESYRMWWLEMPPEEANRRITAVADHNEIHLKLGKGLKSIVLHLGEPLVDLDREIAVFSGEKEVFRGRLERHFRDLLEDLETDGWDTSRAAPARLEIALDP